MISHDSRGTMLDRLIWKPDRVLLNDLVFRIEHARDDNNWDVGDECFSFYKTKYLVDQYAQFLATRPSFRAENILELGIWDGGSVAFWYELFLPRKHVGLDLTQRTDSDYFRRYVMANGLTDAIATHWGVDQADEHSLREIVAREFSGPLDLVIDDASHLYGPTRKSFEVLFPLLRPGGLYMVEDWAWEHWAEFQSPDHAWANEKSPTAFVVELVAAAGARSDVIANMSVFQGFVAVERGSIDSASISPFSIEQFVSYRSPVPSPSVPGPSPSVFRRVLEAAMGRIPR
jgi:hypothetical protein